MIAIEGPAYSGGGRSSSNAPGKNILIMFRFLGWFFGSRDIVVCGQRIYLTNFLHEHELIVWVEDSLEQCT